MKDNFKELPFRLSRLRTFAFNYFFLIIFFGFTRISNEENGKDIVRRMYERFHNKWYHSLTYTQKTEFYKKDKFNGMQLWYIKIIFPDVLRTDYIDPKRRNTDIITKDTLWEFRKELVRNIIPGVGDPLFLTGEIYFKTLDQDYYVLKTQGIDLDKAYSTEMKGRSIYVIGARADGEKVNQIWVDAKELFIIRIIYYSGNTKLDQVLENQVKVGGGWCETKSSTFIDEALNTVETYSDLHFDELTESAEFDPRRFLEAKNKN
jgi:hypothetical protein